MGPPKQHGEALDEALSGIEVGKTCHKIFYLTPHHYMDIEENTQHFHADADRCTYYS